MAHRSAGQSVLARAMAILEAFDLDTTSRHVRALHLSALESARRS